MQFLYRSYSAPEKCATASARYRPAPGVSASLHDGGIVLLHTRRGVVFSSNRVGARIWKDASQRHSVDEVASSISGAFHVPPQDALRDASAFLTELEAEGLLIRDGN